MFQEISKKINKYIFALCLIFLIIGIFYCLQTQPWNHPDEFGHFTYIKYIQKNLSIPTYLNSFDFWESHQPPLYYILVTPIVWLLSNQSIITQLIAARIFSLIFAIANIITIFLIYRIIFNNTEHHFKRYLIIIGTTLAALWPMYIFISSGLNNDNLANLLGSLSILYILKLRQWFDKNNLVINLNKKIIYGSLLISALLLTKTSLYFFAVLILAMMLYYLCRYYKKNIEIKRRNLIYNLTLLGGLVFIFSAWFFVRNLIVVGDLFGWHYFDLLYQQQKSDILTISGFYTWLKYIIKSTLGIFGYFNILIKSSIIYKVFYGILFFSLLGNIYYFYKKSIKNNFNILLIYFTYLLIFTGTFIYSINAYQPQGRYLFPCLSAIILFITLGIFFHIKNKKVLLVISIFTFFSMIIFSIINLKTIIKSEYMANLSKTDESNLLEKKWNSKNARITKNETNYGFIGSLTFSADVKNALIYSFGDIRQDTSLVQGMTMEIKTSNVSKIKITPAFIANNYFDENYSSDILVNMNGIYNIYTIDFKNFYPVNPEIIFGLEIRIVEGDGENMQIEIKNFSFK